MDYKKILPSKSVRLKILSLLNLIPDSLMIRLQYFIKTGRRLNLKHPKRYTEKLQWYKLNYRDEKMRNASDKYRVREYVQSKGLEDILNPLYGVYENVDDIDFNELPISFAIKFTNGSGKNLFIKDKNQIDENEINKTLKSWLNTKYVNYGREWAYDNIKPRIIIEKLLPRDKNNDLPDYKFFCFNGKVEYLYVMIEYTDNHKNGKCSFFTKDFKQLPYRRSEYAPIDKSISKPENFKKMIEIAEILSKDFPHVRVDLYNIDGEIVFGELTFYNAAGYTVFSPDEFDYILGDKFTMPL